MVEARVCTGGDIGVVYDLICELKGEKINFEGFKKAYENKIKSKENHLILAMSQGEVIGFLSLTVYYQLHHAGKVGTIEELIVNTSLRGKGVGKMLVNNAVDYAMKNKCEIIELVSGFKREGAHKFYEKIGFTKRGYNFEMKLT